MHLGSNVDIDIMLNKLQEMYDELDVLTVEIETLETMIACKMATKGKTNRR